MVRNTSALVAAAKLCDRAGAKSLNLGWQCPHEPPLEDNHHCGEEIWFAQAEYNQAILHVIAVTPGAACYALAERLLATAQCKCGKRATLDNDETGRCLWQLWGDEWRPSCKADPIPMGDHVEKGDLAGIGKQYNRAQRRRQAREHARDARKAKP